ncbi:FAD-dependent oxidoreductase [Mycobacterium sp. CVI_P3]|uniref:FAD-dependent oxidoreductase n=1 Tax=Mycobacterium pinniadriaticum TaxID=2994102 RepID=A0ABT3S7Y3_9MYCO|nr:FAD-dependent oxidoreductase [Mycobacterium pinniadriaticum]MCX2929191.1 FAD-dependent oxidoreductase [Mycobacterium pinniadriaticum]MCX2935616.1 FAD-dependent oxidoreductase [Mycobacterium pinniadriaticum]
MTDSTTCAIVGGGPAGMVLGLLLARAGIEVTVLEKHADFLRDFRGDTVHPTTLRLLDELGLWERFTELPHSKVDHAELTVRGKPLTMVDFRRLHQPHPYVAMVPQWDLLNLLAEAGEAEPTYTLRLRHEVTGLLRSGERTIGVTYTSPDGDGELRADLTVACDGRWSIVRQCAGLTGRDFPVPFDVWWFRLPREGGGEYTLIPRIAPGRVLIMIPREGYFQVAYLIPKGSDQQLRARGLDALKAELADLIPEANADSLTSLDDVKFLDVRLNRLNRWHTEGLLCIGDAAHAMSPVGGVGINVAVQDAVGAATLLADPLRRHAVTDRDLSAVRKRRLPPTLITQAVQRMLHRQLVAPILRGESADPPALVTGLIERLPWLAAIPAYFIGIGVRPEHAPDFARR